MKLHRMAAWLLALTLVLLLALPPLAETEHIWRLGDTGEQVERIQARLMELDYLTSPITGIFDETTETALIRFQSRNGLLITGMADEKTLERLFSEGAKAERAESEVWFLAEEAAVEGGVYDAAVLAAPLATRMPIIGATMRWRTNEYTFFQENGFQAAVQVPLSTFAADVDTA